jgi:type IV pilus assembly protein PilC
MPTFEWKGTGADRRVVGGTLVADNKDAAIATLRRQRIVVTAVKEKGKEIAIKKFGGSVPAKNLSIFTRQFSVMIDAGLPLVQCLEILGSQEPNKTFAKVIMQVRADVESGSSLADAMRKHPKAFDNLFTNMIAAGEAGGILDTILQRLSTYIEKNVKLKSQVKSAMIYPIAVLSVAAIVVAVILWKVIPTFSALFISLGATLPLPTRITVAMSNFLVDYIVYIVIGIIVAVVAIKQYYATYKGRRVIDAIMLKAPVLGMLLRKIAVARFCRTLSTLTSSGVAIMEGLDITARTAGNSIIEDAILKVRKAVEEGKTISEPLRDTGVFPSMVCQMLSVGEGTGALDTMLAKIADFYEDEVDTAVAGMMKLLEPIIITILGVVIGFIVVAMYMPMFSLISKMT